ncbi:anti-sigma-V factor RsiV [Clostridium puniceum]|uniref:Anti-sigma-V factor RsiV n=1 Tax=Clostridium puniceum TaxID=29367 RepID=A0A1S8T828_9CLOT|nr:DUF3298 and DUF4163 domain-containing protein [Clostridium puniceum]OOM73774.1 anti-sigma-V factor RsiV [Clostridium puniceum]
MAIISNIAGLIIIGSILYTAYPQEMCISAIIQRENKFALGEKSISKSLDYFKEDIKMPQILDGNDEKKINLINNVINNDILPKSEEAEKTSKEYFGMEGQEKPTFPFEVYSRYTIGIDNNMLISLYNDYYEYLGGAHGMTTRTSYTIDKEKEKLLTLKELFVQGYSYSDIINKSIKEDIEKHPDDYFNSGSEFKGIGENQSFYIEGDKLVIYYQLYDIAPYVFGIPEFKIPLKLFGANYVYYKSLSS